LGHVVAKDMYAKLGKKIDNQHVRAPMNDTYSCKKDAHERCVKIQISEQPGRRGQSYGKRLYNGALMT